MLSWKIHNGRFQIPLILANDFSQCYRKWGDRGEVVSKASGDVPTCTTAFGGITTLKFDHTYDRERKLEKLVTRAHLSKVEETRIERIESRLEDGRF